MVRWSDEEVVSGVRIVTGIIDTSEGFHLALLINRGKDVHAYLFSLRTGELVTDKRTKEKLKKDLPDLSARLKT